MFNVKTIHLRLNDNVEWLTGKPEYCFIDENNETDFITFVPLREHLSLTEDELVNFEDWVDFNQSQGLVYAEEVYEYIEKTLGAEKAAYAREYLQKK